MKRDQANRSSKSESVKGVGYLNQAVNNLLHHLNNNSNNNNKHLFSEGSILSYYNKYNKPIYNMAF